MIIRNLNYLSLSKASRKTTLEIHDKKHIGLVYIPEKGYALFIDNEHPEENMFLIETSTTPVDLLFNKAYTPEFDQTIYIVEAIFDEIYKDITDDDFEFKDSKNTLAILLDQVNESEEILDKNSKLYKIIDNGFLKLDLDEIKNNLQQNMARQEPVQPRIENNEEKEEETLGDRFRNFFSFYKTLTSKNLFYKKSITMV
ncbi:hypothetical protein [Methanosphaera sp. WGK6]|uniref:hypothetical protein n=1 Tax=Methanosphaera sp. WGK6 TaxID=1561964 RepID=UPI00084C9B99|nr:hypothetical protein [Methanosphaera sp. WGK6]OED30391.1 hypothetical protein NL43_03210 [Methanosphaera sp. WGK6]